MYEVNNRWDNRLTSRLDRHIRPIRLLLWAIRADSLIEREARPLYWIAGDENDGGEAGD